MSPIALQSDTMYGDITDLLMAVLFASSGVELFATPQPQASLSTPFWYSALAQEGVLFIAL